MSNRLCLIALWLVLNTIAVLSAQQSSQNPSAQPSTDVPAANPGRPSVSTPATITPVGYLQFESGILGASESPAVASQVNISEVIKYSVSSRIELLVSSEPYAHSDATEEPANAAGDVALGIQGVVHHGKGADPTVSLAYFGRVYEGASPDLDIGSFRNSALLLVSAKVKGFHYDANLIADEAVNGPVRRAQIGQALAISHPLNKKFGVTGEIWHFTQPFVSGNAVGNLWSISYKARRNVVLDCGFDHGLTSTSTQWEGFAGLTYLLPRKLPLTWQGR